MPKPPMRLALLGHSEVEPTCYPHFLKYHPFPFHHFSPSTTINNFQVHHPFMYTTSTKNSLHLSSSLFHLSLGSKTLYYKKSRATFLLPLTSQKALCMLLTPFTKAYIIQVTILATNFFFLLFFFIRTLWIYEVILLLYFYSLYFLALYFYVIKTWLFSYLQAYTMCEGVYLYIHTYILNFIDLRKDHP